MLPRKAYFIGIVAAFLFSSAVLGFTAWLNTLSFRQNYTDSLVRSYALAGRGVAGKIEYALKYGKPLANFFGLEDLLAEVNQCLPAAENVGAVLPDGRIVADLNGPVTNRRMNADLFEKLIAGKDRLFISYFTASQGDRQHVIIPIRNQAKWAGSIDIIFAKQLIETAVDRLVGKLLIDLICLSLAATVLFVGLFRFFVIEGQRKINPKRLQISLIVVLTLAQIIYGYLNYALFEKGYQDVTRDNAFITAKIIRNDIEAVIAKGATYGGLYQLDSYFNKTVGALPEIAAIRLTDSHDRVLSASAGVSGNDWRKAPAELLYVNRLRPDSEGESAKLNMLLSQTNINRKIRALLLDAVTVLTISFFLMLELTLLVMMVLRLKLNRSQGSPRESLWDCGGIRPLAFIAYQAMFLTATFVPVMMKTFQSHLAGLPDNLAVGLPVSVEMFCGLIATVAAGYWTDRKGWRATFAMGLPAFISGTVLSGIAAEPLMFIVGRGLAGSGAGALVIAMRSCVISHPSSQAGSSGIAAMTAGATSGINCAVVTGALLADRIGYAGVFYLAAGMSLVTLPFLLQTPAQRLEAASGTNEARRPLAGAFRKFILNSQVLRFLGMVLIPLSVCAMFLNYYFPLFASKIGVSASDTGRAFLLNGLCPVLLGPALSKFIGRKLSAGRSMLVAAALTGGAIVAFAARGSLAAALMAIVALGVAESFGTAAQVEYFMNLAAVREYGQGKALSYFSLTGKLGNMLGPMAFGGVAFLGLTSGTGVIGGAVLLAVCIFAAVAARTRNTPGRRAIHGTN